MPEDAPRPAQAAIRTELGAIFVSLASPTRRNRSSRKQPEQAWR
jgi:hypothetical protein